MPHRIVQNSDDSDGSVIQESLSEFDEGGADYWKMDVERCKRFSV